jgi:hypothetical protein|uniref:Uncharacterized protein n=2 Tax=Picea TaxID=3328 RepID=A0A117NJC6_PICGL|nr:hypothetical protein ABT39_MTgene1079 [Picea glauca]QHR89995.1 hypothetical protein Q903MT_gene4017 [Picea sitchensis]
MLICCARCLDLLSEALWLDLLCDSFARLGSGLGDSLRSVDALSMRASLIDLCSLYQGVLRV